MLHNNLLLKSILPISIQKAGTHRKPRWFPVAKSKIYRIPKKPEVPLEEKIELKRINDNYHTQMRALKKYFYDELQNQMKTVESASSEMNLKIESDDWERSIALNEKWNKERALEREKRRKAELVAMEKKALEKMIKQDEEQQKLLQIAEQEIRIQKELSATFITPETIDAAIEHAINNPIDYNYCIDLKGNKVQGRDTPFEIAPKKQENQQSII